jgi:hypothetical protein
VNERKRIEDRIRKKDLELQELEIKVREGRVYIQALNDVLKMLPKDTKEAESIGDGTAALREGSLAYLARESILKIGKPAHVSELLADIGKDDTRENRTSLSGTLAAYVRKGEIFTRPAPNKFGLIELGHAQQALVRWTMLDAKPTLHCQILFQRCLGAVRLQVL